MFAGTFARRAATSPSAPPETLLNCLYPFHAPDRKGSWQAGPFLLAQGLVFNTPESHHEETPWRDPESGLVIAAWARIDNRVELAERLQLSQPLDEVTDPQIILFAYRKWGVDCVKYLLGDFAFALIDPQARSVFLARDPLGVKPFYYRLDDTQLQFASSAAVFEHVPGWQAEKDPDWMARYLMHHSQNPITTAYRDVFKLPPGHWLLVEEEHTRRGRYFDFHDDAPPATRRNEKWVNDYRAVLEETIRNQMRSTYPLGSENSGGIDSATITAYLAEFLGTPGDRLFSFGFAHAEQEPAFILETSRVKHIAHNYIATGRALEQNESITRGLAAIGYPEEHSNSISHIPFYKEAELHNIRTLFSGFGGDEVVTNPGQHLRWELLDAGNLPGMWNILPGNLLTRPLRLAKLLTLGRKKPAYNPNFLNAWNERWPHYIIHPQVVERLNLHETYMETARYDAPYRRINDFILQHHLTRMLITTRLENCTLVAASYGIDYRWPLWDVRLVQQYLSTPSIEKVGPNGVGRYLHRRAIDKVVPKMVAWKPSKDMGYAALHQEAQETGIIEVAERAREMEPRLHPALDELIDRKKFREQIARAAQGKADRAFAFAFRRSFGALNRLQAWLDGGKMAG